MNFITASLLSFVLARSSHNQSPSSRHAFRTSSTIRRRSTLVSDVWQNVSSSASRPSISTQRTCHGASAPYVQVTVVGPPIATAIAGVVRIVKLRRWPPQTWHGVPGGNSSKSAPQSEQLSLTLIIAPRLGTSAWPPYSARSTNRIVVLRPDSYRRVA